MESKLAKAIKLHNQPVAIIKADTVPESAVQFQPGKWGCVISLLAIAARGRTAACGRENTTCPGGSAGLGFKPFALGTIEYFLSDGSQGPKEGEFYKETPELARAYVTNVPKIAATDAVIFRPLNQLQPQETPESIVFLVNADQLSALVTLANYDRATQDQVTIQFGAGCVQSILLALKNEEEHRDQCIIGLTDPSARKCIDKDLLSFSIPYHRYLELEEKVAGSFLTKETWVKLSERIQ